MSDERRFELKDGSSAKFWSVTVNGKSHTVRFGRIGSSGQVRTKTFGSRKKATAAAETLIDQKTKKGYKPAIAPSLADPVGKKAKRPRASTTSAKEIADVQIRPSARRQLATTKTMLSYLNRLSKKRAQFIRDIASDKWIDRFDLDSDEATFEKESRRWDRLRKEFLRTVTNPIELHCFAVRYNCDNGSQPIYRVVTHPYCDAGTALWLYWEREPYSLSRYADVKSAKHKDEQLDIKISRVIERRFRRNDFRSTKIPIDPSPFIDDEKETADGVVHKIPRMMRNPVGLGKRRVRA